MKYEISLQWNTTFSTQKVLGLLSFGFCPNCMKSANLFAEIQLKLLNERALIYVRERAFLQHTAFLKFLIFCVTFWKFWNYETRCHRRRWDQHQYTSIFNIKYGKTRFWMAFFSVIITTACTNYSYKHYYVSKPVYKLCI